MSMIPQFRWSHWSLETEENRPNTMARCTNFDERIGLGWGLQSVPLDTFENPSKVGGKQKTGDFPLIISPCKLSQLRRCSCISCYNSTSHIVKMVWYSGPRWFLSESYIFFKMDSNFARYKAKCAVRWECSVGARVTLLQVSVNVPKRYSFTNIVSSCIWFNPKQFFWKVTSVFIHASDPPRRWIR